MSAKTTASKARTRRAAQPETPVLAARVSRASRRGKYAFTFTGEPEAVDQAMGEMPSVAPVRSREKDGVKTVSVRVGANPASRVLGTIGVEDKASAAVAAGEDTGGAPHEFAPEHVPALAAWIGQAVRVWADRRSSGQTGVAGPDAVDSVAIGIAAGDESVSAAMSVRATIARRPTIVRAAVIRRLREAAAPSDEDAGEDA